jgi:predicted branched-subunit amino acid permease
LNIFQGGEVKKLSSSQAAFWRGFAAILPLWLAAAPFGLAYALAAQAAELSGLETQLMSLFVFAAAAQMALVQLLSTSTSLWIILLTMLVMNLHHLLYGLSLSRQINFSRRQRLLAAFWLTDAAFGVTVTDDKDGKLSFLLGAELSMFVAWNLFTGIGLWLGSVVTIPPEAQLDFVVPLTFFLLLVLVIRTRLDLLVAVVSVGLAVTFSKLGLGNTAVLLTGIIGPLVGLVIGERRK